jgi:hypothetical protein
MRDQIVARLLPTHKHRINANIHTLSGIRTHDPSVVAGEDISVDRSHYHCDRPTLHQRYLIRTVLVRLLFFIISCFKTIKVC